MKFLNFNTLLDKNIHIHNGIKLKKFNKSLYRSTSTNSIVNLTYTSICLYKLYKIFYILNFKNIYVSFIHFVHSNNDKFINLLLKLTNNNLFNSQYYIKGIINNENMLNNILILGSWLNKVLYFHGKNIIMPRDYTASVKQRIEYICSNLKFRKFSKFIFLFDVEKESYYLKECTLANKFIMGLCDLNFNKDILDFFIYGNNLNHISINFLTQFIIASQINSGY